MKLKKQEDGKVFANIEKSLTRFQDTLSKFDFTSTTSSSQDHILLMVSCMESCFKMEL